MKSSLPARASLESQSTTDLAPVVPVTRQSSSHQAQKFVKTSVGRQRAVRLNG
jgi:hypothetical protein